MEPSGVVATALIPLNAGSFHEPCSPGASALQKWTWSSFPTRLKKYNTRGFFRKNASDALEVTFAPVFSNGSPLLRFHRYAFAFEPADTAPIVVPSGETATASRKSGSTLVLEMILP